MTDAKYSDALRFMRFKKYCEHRGVTIEEEIVWDKTYYRLNGLLFTSDFVMKCVRRGVEDAFDSIIPMIVSNTKDFSAKSRALRGNI